MFWNRVNALFDRLGSFFEAVPLLLGLGFCRACLGWVLEMTKAASGVADGHLYLILGGVGQFAGFALVLLAVRKTCSWTERAPLMLFASFGSLAVGASFIFATMWLGLDVIALAAGCVLASLGYAALFAMWIELYGLFTPKKFLLAFSLSYAVNLGMWLAMRGMDVVLSFAVCLLSAAVSCTMLVAAYRSHQGADRPVARPDVKGFPWAVVAWVLAFSFAYSLADGITGLGHTSIPSKLGMAIPCVITLVGICALSKQFSSKLFLAFAFLLMVSGLGCTFFSDAPHWLPQLAMSAAIEAQTIMILVIACQYGRKGRSSAAFFYCLLQMATVLASRLALLPTFDGLDGERMTMLWIAVFLLVAVVGASLFATRFFSDGVWFERAMSPSDTFLAGFVDRYGLTQRESTVLALLAEGRTYEEMAEELFIAQGTVRAHVGHIFEKMSVHSRWELEQKIREDALRAG